MIVGIYSKTDFAVRYFEKLRVPVKSRPDALSRFMRLKKLNLNILEEIMEEGYKEQVESFNLVERRGLVKTFRA